MTLTKWDIPKAHDEDLAKAAESTRHLKGADPGTWRAWIRPIVAEIVEMIKACNMDEKEARREFREAWRWGPRKHWPYRVWRDEIALQTGKLTGRISPRKATAWKRQLWAEKAGQQRLFE